MNDKESKDGAIKTPDYEWDITINCNQKTNTIIKLISGGSVCILRARELFRDAMQTKIYEDKEDKIKYLLHDVRQAMADYMQSEGCSCCQDINAHNEHKARLAKLLNVPMYGDKSGYDFGKFKTEAI